MPHSYNLTFVQLVTITEFTLNTAAVSICAIFLFSYLYYDWCKRNRNSLWPVKRCISHYSLVIYSVSITNMRFPRRQLFYENKVRVTLPDNQRRTYLWLNDGRVLKGASQVAFNLHYSIPGFAIKALSQRERSAVLWAIIEHQQQAQVPLVLHDYPIDTFLFGVSCG